MQTDKNMRSCFSKSLSVQMSCSVIFNYPFNSVTHGVLFWNWLGNIYSHGGTWRLTRIFCLSMCVWLALLKCRTFPLDTNGASYFRLYKPLLGWRRTIWRHTLHFYLYVFYLHTLLWYIALCIFVIDRWSWNMVLICIHSTMVLDFRPGPTLMTQMMRYGDYLYIFTLLPDWSFRNEAMLNPATPIG